MTGATGFWARSLPEWELRLASIRLALRLVWGGARRWVAASVILNVSSSLLPVATIFLTKWTLDTVTLAISLPESGRGPQFVRLAWLVGAGAALAFVSLGLQIASAYIAEVQGAVLADHIQEKLLEQGLAVDLDCYEDRSFQDKLHLARQEALTRPLEIVSSLTGLLTGITSLLGMIGMLVTLRWWMPLAVAGAALPAALLRMRYAGVLYRWQKETASEQRRAGYFGYVPMDAWHAKEVRLFGHGRWFLRRFLESRAELREQRLVIARARSGRELVTGILGVITGVALQGYLLWLVLFGGLTLGGLVAYQQAYQRAQVALGTLLNSVASLYQNSLYLTNLQEFMDLKPGICEPAVPAVLALPLKQGVRFEDVVFSYPRSDRPALQGVTFEVPAGKLVALVGENGSGKTTLTKLLCRLYDPDSGRVLLDGIDLRDLDAETRRRAVGPILQDYVRYQLSARENIWLGDQDLSPEDPRVQDAGRMAGIDPVLSGLPQGYDTQLGRMFEGGEELSIGQWQRLALARTLLRNAPILVLDEPTSALDPRAEAALVDQLAKYAQGKTTLLISHRLSTVRLADVIHVLDQGRIVESGTHEELLRRGGLYAEMYQAQSRMYQDVSA